YGPLDALAKAVLARVDKFNLDDDKKARARTSLKALALYAAYGQVEQVYEAGDYKKVCELTDPLVAQIKEGKLPEAEGKLRPALLSLALKANVQEGKVEHAQEILKLIQDAAKDDEQAATQLMLGLVQSLKVQIQELHKKGPAAKAQLDKTTDSF